MNDPEVFQGDAKRTATGPAGPLHGVMVSDNQEWNIVSPADQVHTSSQMIVALSGLGGQPLTHVQHVMAMSPFGCGKLLRKGSFFGVPFNHKHPQHWKQCHCPQDDYHADCRDSRNSTGT